MPISYSLFPLPSKNDKEQRTNQLISVLGLDVGNKRIGIAGCDGTGLIATGLTTLKRGPFQQDVAQFQALIESRQVQRLVVGLPYSMNGTVGSQAKRVKKYAKRLAKALNLPLEFVDERLTSFTAEQMMVAQNISPSRNKELIDRKAAAIILQQWLDQQRQTVDR